MEVALEFLGKMLLFNIKLLCWGVVVTLVVLVLLKIIIILREKMKKK